MNITTETAFDIVARELGNMLLVAPYRTLAVMDETGLTVDHLDDVPRAILVGALAWRDVLPSIQLTEQDKAEGVELSTRRRWMLIQAVKESLAQAGLLRWRYGEGKMDEEQITEAVCRGVAVEYNREATAEMCRAIVALRSSR